MGKILHQEDKVPASHLRSLFLYNPETGIITRIVAAGNCSKGDTLAALDREYFYVRVTWAGRKRKIYAHVLAWVLFYGDYPTYKIAHLNDDHGDNRINNLCERDDRHHARRMRIGLRNNSGAKGVFWDARRQLWRAEITVDRKSIFLGRFADKYDALSAYIAASKEYHGDEGRVDVDWKTFRSRSF